MLMTKKPVTIYRECPFCGNDDDDQKSSIITFFGMSIMCKLCNTFGPPSHIDAAESWNKRSPTTGENEAWNNHNPPLREEKDLCEPAYDHGPMNGADHWYSTHKPSCYEKDLEADDLNSVLQKQFHRCSACGSIMEIPVPEKCPLCHREQGIQGSQSHAKSTSDNR